MTGSQAGSFPSRPRAPGVLRRVLNGLYVVASFGSCVGMVLILILVTMQMTSRIVGVIVPGVDDIAGYCVVAVIFLGLAPALNAGAHIRVMLMLNALPSRAIWVCAVFCHVVALALAVYFAYWTINFAYDSYRFGDVSHGMLKTPLWIPHSMMGIGLFFFVIALLDGLVTTLLSSPEAIDDQYREVEHTEAGEL